MPICLRRTAEAVIWASILAAGAEPALNTATPAVNAARPAANTARPAGLEDKLFAVTVNGQSVTQFARVLAKGESEFYLSGDVLKSARLRLPSAPAIEVDGQAYYPLGAIAGAVVRINSEQQSLDVTAPPDAFDESHLDVNGLRGGKPQPSEPGLFLNHNFQFTRGPGTNVLSGLVEGGLFSNLGVLVSRYNTADLVQGRHIVRLDTQFFRDFPDRKATLAIGDSISASNAWSGRIYFAGVQWASKFSTQPDFVPFVLPSMSGLAVQPSMVDVYVNNVKTLSQQVDTGPFAIHNIPIVTGQGQMQMVVTDALGRQQLISQPYISSIQLLRKGTSEYTYEAGSPRQNMGQTSYGYRSFFFEGTHRYGITDKLTIEGRAELGLDNRTAGGGLTWSLNRIGIMSAGVAGSFDGRLGKLVYADYSRPAQGFMLSAHYQSTSGNFRQLGLNPWQRPAGQLIQGSISHPLGSRVIVSASYLQRDGRTEPTVRGPFASVGVRLGRAYLNIGGNYSTVGKPRYGATIALLIPLGERLMASSMGNVNSQTGEANFTVERTLPIGPGYGYKVQVDSFDRNAVTAGFSYQDNQGSYTAEAERTGQQTNLRFSEMGSLIFLHKHILATRWLNDSFAVVEVPGEQNADIFVNNQLGARTNRSGLAVVPWLVPYDKNLVRVDQRGIPIDASLDLSERTAIPFPRTGVYMKIRSGEDQRGNNSAGDRGRAACPPGSQCHRERETNPVSGRLPRRGFRFRNGVPFRTHRSMG